MIRVKCDLLDIHLDDHDHHAITVVVDLFEAVANLQVDIIRELIAGNSGDLFGIVLTESVLGFDRDVFPAGNDRAGRRTDRRAGWRLEHRGGRIARRR